ncbi:MAG: hypothetical protein P4M13_04320 [Alphaproteobacteria bacterium]|nr:hypothetical protein [Alphaproteobacteria bacterium]
MLSSKLYTQDHEVDGRLTRFPGKITHPELIEVVRLILSARADAIAVDPLSAAGQFSYIFGTRHLRLLLCPKGWVIDRTDNVESVRHEASGISIVFQNADQACVPMQGPKALHGKGAAAVRMIGNSQGVLFPNGEIPEAIPPQKLNNLNSAVWYFCVSFNNDEAQAELSLPATLNGTNFGLFIERIFITLDGDDPLISGKRTDDTGPAEGVPLISRK